MLLTELEVRITEDALELTELDEGNPRLDVEERDDDDDGNTLELLILREDWLLAAKSNTTAWVRRLLNKLGPATERSIV